MPTGYTAQVADGKLTFEQFATNCSFAFLGCLRDINRDTLPDVIPPSDYYSKSLEGVTAKLKAARKMSEAAASKLHRKSENAEAKQHTSWTLQRAEQKRNYINMTHLVQGWQPPTKDHEALKKFMLEQLATSIEHDCDWKPTPPKIRTLKEWKKDYISNLERDVEHYAQEYAAELKRCREATDWILALKRSLK